MVGPGVWPDLVVAKDTVTIGCASVTRGLWTGLGAADRPHRAVSQQQPAASGPREEYMGFGSLKATWTMAHNIRTALIEPEIKLGGVVEVDETWIGGKDYNRHRDKKSGGRGGKGSGKTPRTIGRM